MKRIVGFVLILGLIVGSLAAPAVAKKKKKGKKPALVQVDQKYFLRRDDCNTDNDNPHLSITDGADHECAWGDAGVAWDVYSQSGLIEPSESYPAADGAPFVLDAAKHITGEITLQGDPCVQDPACLPSGGLSAGQAVFDLHAFATIGDEEKDLGLFEDKFTTTPGSTHTSKVDLPIDAALAGQTVSAFRIEVYFGGEAVGPGDITLENPASFIIVPTLATK